MPAGTIGWLQRNHLIEEYTVNVTPKRIGESGPDPVRPRTHWRQNRLRLGRFS